MAKTSREGRQELVSLVQAKLMLATKKEAEHLVGIVIECLENTLLNHLDEDGFSMKLNGLGKLSVHHKPAIRRKVGFSGETIRTKQKRKIRFVSLGRLRQFEPKEDARGLGR